MDFDQMLETWRAQNTAPPYSVNRDALRQALQAQDALVLRVLRARRWLARFFWIFGTGMAVFAGFWIAITITNGWPAIYAIAAGASFGLFALGGGALWMSGGREPAPNFGNTLEEEVRRSLALIDYRLSNTRRWTMFLLGAASISISAMLFGWTLNSSQDIPDSSFTGYAWAMVGIAVVMAWACYKVRDAMRKAKPTLQLRQRHLRELLAALDARE
jgi:hypothetical protein